VPPSPPSPTSVGAIQDLLGAQPFVLGARMVFMVVCIVGVSVQYLNVLLEVDSSLAVQTVPSVAALGRLLQPTLSLAGQPSFALAVPLFLPWSHVTGAPTSEPPISPEQRDKLLRAENQYAFAVVMAVYYLSEPYLCRAIRRCQQCMQGSAVRGAEESHDVAVRTALTSRGAADGDLVASGRLLGFAFLVVGFCARLHYTLTQPPATMSQALLELSEPCEAASRVCFKLFNGCILAWTSKAFSRFTFLDSSWTRLLPLTIILALDSAVFTVTMVRTGHVSECATHLFTGLALHLLGHYVGHHANAAMACLLCKR
jgi:hypothetical protein